MSEPTDHGPGSLGKIDVLTERYATGLPLWHDDDARYPKAEPTRPALELEDEFGYGLFDGEDD